MQECISATTLPATRILRRSSSDLFTAPRLGAAGVDGCDQARGDLVGGAQAVDRYEQVALLVPLDQRRRLTLVEVEALADRFGGVVGSLHDLAAAVVAHPAVLGGHVDGVVCTAVGADPAGGEALEHDVGGDHEVDDEVEGLGLGDLGQQLGLPDGAREAIEDVATVAGVVAVEPLLHHAAHDLVGDELTAVHYLLGLAPELRALLDGGAEHRSEAHTSELQSLMRISYAVFCLKKKTPQK